MAAKQNNDSSGCGGCGLAIVCMLVLSLAGIHPILGVIGGFIMIALYIYGVNIEEEKLKKSRIVEVDKMTGVEFESYLAAVFRSSGYFVEMTPATGDYGADLILHRGGSRIVVQAKRYSSSVSNKAVQEVYSAKDYYNADEAWVVTNASYTSNAQKTANKLSVKLIGRRELIELAGRKNN